MRWAAPLALASVLMTTAAAAQTYARIGAGTSSCGTWTAARRNMTGANVQNEAWVFGFLSGVGWVGQNGDNPLQGLDGNAVSAWVDNYCRSNPLKSIGEAAGALAFAHPR